MFNGTFREFFPDIESLEIFTATRLMPIITPHRIRFHAETLLIILSVYAAVNLITARYVVDGPSMEPNFITGQFIVVNRLLYWFASPARGDVIVFHNPEDPSRDLIKRVIGLPDETIRIEDGSVYVNGKLLLEPYVKSLCANHRCDSTWTLDATHYLVLGDNRNQSHDGHNFGPLDRTLIVGRAWARYWPPTAWGMIPSVSYKEPS